MWIEVQSRGEYDVELVWRDTSKLEGYIAHRFVTQAINRQLSIARAVIQPPYLATAVVLTYTHRAASAGLIVAMHPGFAKRGFSRTKQQPAQEVTCIISFRITGTPQNTKLSMQAICAYITKLTKVFDPQVFDVHL